MGFSGLFQDKLFAYLFNLFYFLRDELIRDVLLWIPTHGRAKAGRPARTYIQQLCEDTGCCPEDLPRAMNDREEWRERVRDIRVTSTIWWWWWRVRWKDKKKSTREQFINSRFRLLVGIWWYVHISESPWIESFFFTIDSICY